MDLHRQHSTPFPATVDVLVVGAGPAGLATAIGLARHGVRPLALPRATGLSVRTLEILRGWGLEGAVRAGAVPSRVGTAVSTALVERPLRERTFGYPDDATAGLHSPTTALTCPQDHHEPVLLQHLRALGGDVRFGTELAWLDDLGTIGDAVVCDVRTDLAPLVPEPWTVHAIERPGPGWRLLVPVGVDGFWVYARDPAEAPA